MNESGKHTEGPWTYLDLGEVVRADDFDVVIASVDYSRESAEADGNLIAAAPDMLSVCRELDDAVKAGYDNSSDLLMHLLRAAEMARAALTKAGSPT